MPELDEATKLSNLQNYERATVPFYVSLGKFLHLYSVLETLMLAALMNVSGVSQPVGKSIYSGTRVSAAKDFINRILDSNGNLDLKERFRPYFVQIGHLNAMRDDILHYGAVYDHDKNVLIVSNDRVAHIPSRLRKYAVNPEMLDNMTHDTQRAICGITFELVGQTAKPDALAFFQAKLASPWRYRPPQPIPQPKTNP